MMASMEVKSFNAPDEVRNFEKGKLDLMKIGGAVVGLEFSSLDGAGQHQ